MSDPRVATIIADMVDERTAAAMRAQSGDVVSSDPFVAFLFVLMRDHVPGHVAEDIIRGLEVGRLKDVADGATSPRWEFDDGWTGERAKHLVQRLAAIGDVEKMKRDAETIVLEPEGETEP